MKFLVLGSILIIIGCRLCRCEDVEEDEYPRVETLSGTIEGIYNISSEGKKYESYMGIPYAVPITEEERFQNAKPVEPWTGVLSAKAFGPWCIQIGVLSLISTDPEVNGAEDCLYLNVFVPTTGSGNETKESTDLIPVIFYIHGGGYQFGSGAEFGPDHLLNERVIFVTSNYRLGPLGFLSTEDSVIPGNLGLKDQVLAMRWVKDNIVYFGGDPDSITLIGQSAGGVSVHLHYMSDLTKGLFNRGMSLSGNALDSWPKSDSGNLEKSRKVADIVGCPSSDVQEMVDCLKTQSAENITLASVQFAAWINAPISPFGAVIEAEENNSSFLTRQPIDLIISGKVHDLPWITSTVSDEGLAPGVLLVVNSTLIKELNDNWDEILPYLLSFNYTIPTSDQNNVSQLIRDHYLGSSPIDNSTINQVIRMIGDRLFYYETERATKLQSLAMKSPVRSFLFSYRGAHSASEIFTNTKINFGVMHLDDLPYTLKVYFNSTTTEEDKKMQKIMTNIWVSFATHGVPNVGVEWPEFDPSLDEYKYLQIAGPDEICINSTSNFGDKNFWRSIPFDENIVTLNNETEIAKN